MTPPPAPAERASAPRAAPTVAPAPRVRLNEPYPDTAGANGDVDLDGDTPPLEARRQDDQVAIRWNPLASDDATVVYLVVAGASAVRAPGMGRAVLLTTDTEVAVAAADGPHYAVFGFRGPDVETALRGRSVRLGTGTAVSDVAGLAEEVSPHSIRLQWSRPAHVASVLVFRNQGAPVPPGFAMNLRRPLDPDQDVLTDEDVEPGGVYHYRIVAVNAEGVQSNGLTRELRVPARPEPVMDLAARTWALGTATYSDLSWTTPVDRAEIRVYVKPTTLLPGIPRDVLLQLADVERMDLGHRVLGVPEVENGRTVVKRVHFPEDEERQFYTPVSVIGDVAVIGTTTAASSVGEVRNVEVVDRVHWQLVRFDWPRGATFVDMVTVHHSGGDAPMWQNAVRINRERYERDGGGLHDIHSPLDVRARDILLRGVNRYSGVEQAGPEHRVEYRGRWIVEYRLQPAGDGRWAVQVVSRFPEVAWRSPPVRVRVLHHPALLPMSPSQPQVRQLPIVRGAGDPGAVGVDLEPGALRSDEVVVVGTVDLPGGYVRVVVDALVPDVPLVVLDPPPPSLLPAAPRATAPLAPTQHRCRVCLEVADRFPQVFECENRECRGRTAQGPFRFTPKHGPVGPGVRPAAHPPLRATETCPSCQRVATKEICRQCLRAIPSDWFGTEPFPIAMAGAKATGKSVYAYVALSELRDQVVRDLRGSVSDYDPETARRFQELKELFRGRRLPVSTGGEDGLDPLTFAVTTPSDTGRQRTLELFDLSGDWVQGFGTVGNYRDQLARAGGIVFLVDVMQVHEVVDYLQGEVATLAREDLQDPLVSLENVIRTIRERLQLPGNQKIPVPIAIAVSKLDALHRLFLRSKGGASGPAAALNLRQGYALTRDPYGGRSSAGPLYDPADGWWVHHETRSLLDSLRAGRITELVEQHFVRSRFFAVSALGHSLKPGSAGSRVSHPSGSTSRSAGCWPSSGDSLPGPRAGRVRRRARARPITPSIGWKVTEVEVADGSIEPDRDLLLAVDAVGQAYSPDVELAVVGRSAEVPTVLKQVRLRGDVVILASFADAGLDRTGRASHVVHGLLHEGALVGPGRRALRPIELLDSPMWVRPVGEAEVSTTSVKGAAFDLPPGPVDLDHLVGDGFLIDLDHAGRVELLPVVLAAFAEALARDRYLLLAVPDRDEVVGWLGLLQGLLDPVSAGALRFSVREEVRSAAAVDRFDLQITGVVVRATAAGGATTDSRLAGLGDAFLLVDTVAACPRCPGPVAGS